MELELDRLTKQYGPKIAVDRVSARLGAGVYGLLGANGAGKTTIMRMICGILRPTSGEVRLDGRPTAEMGGEFRARLGYLPQDFGYYPEFTALDFMEYMAALKGLDSRAARTRSLELLDRVGLAGEERRLIRTFSGGMKQRLGIAQAVLNDPDVLVLDEPTAGLDPKERVRFRNLIASFAADKIVLLSTHHRELRRRQDRPAVHAHRLRRRVHSRQHPDDAGGVLDNAGRPVGGRVARRRHGLGGPRPGSGGG